MTETILAIIIALLIVVLALTLRRLSALRGQIAQANTQNALLQQACRQAEATHATALQQAEQIHQHDLQTLRQQAEERLQTLRQQHEDRLQMAQQQNEERLQAMQRQNEEQMRTLRLEIDQLSQKHLNTQREQLRQQNAETITQMLAPLRSAVETFSKDFTDRMNEQGKTSAVMEVALKNLAQQTQQLGKNADDLAHALTTNNKTQGDWGEGVLTNILTASGLTEGIDFETQKGVQDEGGSRFIPDVIVKLPDGHRLIIDAKTSLTDYVRYAGAEDEAARKEALAHHLKSVRSHVNELADKRYPDKVSGAQEYVLMFIPNEGGYLLAMDNDKTLAIDAYKRHIIIVNPTNLLLALNIVFLFRQNERQTKSVRDIIQSAKSLYEKFATFSNSFVDIGERLQRLTEAYNKADAQLSTGKGNFAKQLEAFKEKGIVTEKKINEKLLPELES